MSATLVLDHDQVREALSPDLLLPAVRTALIATSREEASTPPRIAAYSPAGVLGAMPGYVPGLGMAGKFVSIFRPDGPGRLSFRQYLRANDHKAFAVSQKGEYAWRAGATTPHEAQNAAREACERKGAVCTIYAVNNELENGRAGAR
jgi:alanine dehydrogenase